jgi:ATP-binding cassette subfamily F protein 3
MSVLKLSQIGRSFGATDLFTGLNAQLAEGQKVGLVGRNGVGKTQLIDIIAGHAEPTEGEVYVPSGTRIGYLPQEAMEAFNWKGGTLRTEMETVFEHLHEMSDRMRVLEAQMVDPEADMDAVLEEYGDLQEEFERLGGYDYEHRIDKTLAGLGFDEEDYTTQLEHLSGGQKTRAVLAKLLLQAPDVLVLDEPTNHLDVEALAWLESHLLLWEGTLIIVSHDRYFLDTVVDTIWELHPDRIEVYRGNYSHYLRQRQERWERHQKLFEQTRTKLENEMDYIAKMIGTPRGKDNAEGRLKQVSRQLAAIDELGLVEASKNTKWSETGLGRVRTLSVSEANKKIRQLRGPSGQPPAMRARFDLQHRGGDIVMTTTDLVVGYPGTVLFSSDKLQLQRGEIAALIGPNGAGKTTFLRTVMGDVEPLHGRVRLGLNVHTGYFAQAHDTLDHEKRVIEELLTHKPGMDETEARNYLAKYELKGDDAYKNIGALSGGERARFALSLMALDGANFLMLDEPTNHLDIPSQEAIQSTLAQFPGTILLVTHDRYLVEALATQIWDLQEGHLVVFRGGYKQFLDAKPEIAEARRKGKELAQTRMGAAHAAASSERLTALEQSIAEAEEKLEAISAEMEEIGAIAAEDHLANLQKDYRKTQQRIATMLHEWEQLATPVEA